MLRLLGILALINMIFGDKKNRRNAGGLLGGLFILPALMFGGWIVLAVLGGVLGLFGMIVGGIFSGLSAVTETVFSGSGLAIGVVLGLALYLWMKKRNAAKEEETASTVDGEAVETEIVEPRQYRHM